MRVWAAATVPMALMKVSSLSAIVEFMATTVVLSPVAKASRKVTTLFRKAAISGLVVAAPGEGDTARPSPMGTVAS